MRDCAQRGNGAQVLRTISQQSPTSTAEYQGFGKCQSVVAHGLLALVHQCKTKRVAILARKRKYRNKPFVNIAKLSPDRHNIISTFKPFLHDGHYIQPEEQYAAWKETDSDWQIAQ